MKQSGQIGKLLFFTALAATAALPTVAAERPLTVIELFTSQGCSSCPSANANLIKVSGRSSILVLSFSVTYWDYLGWKDTYGRPEFTARQVNYEPALRQAGPYTPQMVVNGETTAVGNSLSEIEYLIDQTPALEGPDLGFKQDRIEVGAGAGYGNADVWLVHYDPQIRSVPVVRGENHGATLQHTHVVHRLNRLGTWAGQKTSFTLPKAEAGLKTAILLQKPNGGRIIASITD